MNDDDPVGAFREGLNHTLDNITPLIAPGNDPTKGSLLTHAMTAAGKITTDPAGAVAEVANATSDTQNAVDNASLDLLRGALDGFNAADNLSREKTANPLATVQSLNDQLAPNNIVVEIAPLDDGTAPGLAGIAHATITSTSTFRFTIRAFNISNSSNATPMSFDRWSVTALGAPSAGTSTAPGSLLVLFTDSGNRTSAGAGGTEPSACTENASACITLDLPAKPLKLGNLYAANAILLRVDLTQVGKEQSVSFLGYANPLAYTFVEQGRNTPAERSRDFALADFVDKVPSPLLLLPPMSKLAASPPTSPDGIRSFDSDGDGWPDVVELALGSDPFDAKSTPSTDDNGNGLPNFYDGNRLTATSPTPPAAPLARLVPLLGPAIIPWKNASANDTSTALNIPTGNPSPVILLDAGLVSATGEDERLVHFSFTNVAPIPAPLSALRLAATPIGAERFGFNASNATYLANLTFNGTTWTTSDPTNITLTCDATGCGRATRTFTLDGPLGAVPGAHGRRVFIVGDYPLPPTKDAGWRVVVHAAPQPPATGGDVATVLANVDSAQLPASAQGLSVFRGPPVEIAAPLEIVAPGPLDHVAFTLAPTATDADTNQTFQALPYDAYGNVRDDAITYSASLVTPPGGNVGSIGAASGVFTPHDAGTVSIVATAGTKNASTLVAVAPAALDHVAFAANTPQVTDADTPVTFVAHGLDDKGNFRDDAITYRLLAGPGALDAATGLYTPGSLGDVTVEADDAAMNATTTLTVNVGALDHVAFTKAAHATSADNWTTFLALPYDKEGNVRGDAVTYARTTGPGAIDATSGVFKPDLVGASTIVATATNGAVTRNATATLDTTVGALANVRFVEGATNTTADNGVQFVALPYDRHGNVRDDTVTYNWDPPGRLDTLTGYFTPDKVGNTTIAANAHDAINGTDIGNVTYIETTVGKLAALDLQPRDATTDADTNLTYTAAPVDAHGNARSDAVTFSIDPAGGDLNATSGLYVPSLAGDFTVSASVGDFVESTALTVNPGPSVSVVFDVDPNLGAQTNADTPVQFAAHSYDDKANERFGSVDFAITKGSGHIDATGLFTPKKTGTTVLAATDGNASASWSILVTNGAEDHVEFTSGPTRTDVDTPVTLVANVTDKEGNAFSDAATYSLTSGPGAINATSGVYTPTVHGLGAAAIRADVGTFNGTFTLTVTAAALDHVAFTATHATTDADTPVQFAASAYDAHDNARTDVIDYSILVPIPLNPGSIGADGIFTPDRVGNTTLEATAHGTQVNATTNLTVTVGALAQIAFYGTAPDRLPADTDAQFTALPLDAHSNERTDNVTYFVAAGPGSIDATGRYTAADVGTVNVSANAGPYTTSFVFEVIPGATATIDIAPSTLTLTSDDTATFSATAYDIKGNPTGDAPVFRFLSPGAGLGSINATTGAFVPDKVGTEKIVADFNGVLGIATVNVTIGALNHVEFTNAPAATAADTPATFAASGVDGHENALSDAATYAIVSGSGSIDAATGVFTPNKVGSTVVRATVGAFHADATIGVGVGGLDHLTWVSAPATTRSDTPVTFSAAAFDARGNARNDTIGYALDTGSGAVDTTTGRFTPHLVGTSTIKAFAGTVSTTTTVVVTLGPADHVAFVNPPTATDTDTRVTFLAHAVDAQGNARADGVTYFLDKGPGAVNATSGAYAPNSVGTAVIRALSGTMSASTSLAVRVGALDHIDFDRAPTSTDVLTAVDFHAVPLDAHGNLRDDPVLYAVVAGTGDIDPASGHFVPNKPGVAHVQAFTTGGTTRTVSLAVVPGPVASIAWSANPAGAHTFQAVQFVAQAYDTRGNTRTDAIHYDVYSGPGTIDATTGEYVAPVAGATAIRAIDGAFAILTTILVEGPSGSTTGGSGSSGTSSTGSGGTDSTSAGSGTNGASGTGAATGGLTGSGGSGAIPLPRTTVRSIPNALVATPFTFEFLATNATQTFTRVNGADPVEGTSVTLTGDGPFVVEYWSVGLGGTEAHHQIDVVGDGTPPRILDARFDPANAPVGATVRVVVQATDANLDQVLAQVTYPDGHTVPLTLEREGDTSNFSTSIVADVIGSSTLTATAYDRAGLSTTSAGAAPLVVTEALAKSSAPTPTSSTTSTPATPASPTLIPSVPGFETALAVGAMLGVGLALARRGTRRQGK
ncbi:MAG: beta strand repeat-containing protein [Thermoplasmatota archaeon]